MSFAQMEREQISERTNLGIQTALEKGIYALGGKLPLGIERDENNHLFYNDEIEMVKEMFDLDNEGFSYTEIQKEINKKYGEILKTKHIVERIIKNTLYRGYKVYKGIKYYFLKSIIRKREEKVTKIKKKNLTKYNYYFHEYIKRDFLVSGKTKLVKSTGEKKSL